MVANYYELFLKKTHLYDILVHDKEIVIYKLSIILKRKKKEIKYEKI